MRYQHSPSPAESRIQALRRLLSLAVVCLTGARALAEETPKSAPSTPVLELMNGGFVRGELEDSAQPGTLRWQSTSFAGPFDFDAKSVNVIHYPPPRDLPKPTGDYCFELAGGDVLFGSLIEMTDKDAELEATPIGRLRVPRSQIHRLYHRRGSTDLVYLGPNGLAGWKQTSPNTGWRGDAGQLQTDQEWSTIQGDLGIPPRAMIELEISWQKNPDFLLALGVDDVQKSIESAFRFEVWDGELVVLRETEIEADVIPVQRLEKGAGRVHLQVYLDQENGRIAVFSTSGKLLADLKVAGAKPRVLTGVHLANKRGDVRLERLRISRWNLEPSVGAQADKTRIHFVDGSIVYGQIAKFDAATREFVVQGETDEIHIPEDRAAGVFLSLPGGEEARSIRAVYQDGTRLSGELTRVQQRAVWLSLPGVQEPLPLPIDGLRSLVVMNHEATPVGNNELVGMLEIEGVHLYGRLVDGLEQPGSSCLVWQPQGSATASALRPGVSGRILYREPPPPVPRPRVTPEPGPAAALRARLLAIARVPKAVQPAPPPKSRTALHLRTGDNIPAEVTRIDESGVWFQTPLSDKTFVAHDKIKAVELALEIPPLIKLNKVKRERLLTLPRMQKESPPTQLIRSKNGDYLRGRVIGMDDNTLQVEVHLETKAVPRDRISRIIWFHADEVDPAQSAAKPSESGAGTLVQALRSDGTRLTFVAENCSNAALAGKSEVLGACRVPIGEVDQLLIGGAIEKAAARLVYQNWKLQNAEEPKVALTDGGQGQLGGNSGVESPLVGKPAPDFELAMLEGKKFHLAERKGNVVVLDFWATWCGPCIASMPQVERVTQEFQEQGVQLVAVNLQENSKQITAMLERHKLGMTVALDMNGVVAEKYGVTAIPQTVIIDRDGNVARLFIGGSPDLADQLRDALSTVLAGTDGKEPAK
jgi:peroxiredoxin